MALESKVNVGGRAGIFRFAGSAFGRLFCFLAAFAIGVGYICARWQQTECKAPAPLQLDAEWITVPDESAYTGYFRTTIPIAAPVKHAWLAISAKNAFEVTINGNLAGQQSLWRPTRPYQTGLSEVGQRIASPQAALELNFPRDYQWDDHDNARVPVWFDITNGLRPGRNVIGVQIESRHLRPSFVAEGAIELWSGEIIPIRSDSTWRAEPVPPGVSRLDWNDTNYLDSKWRTAAAGPIPATDQLIFFDARIFQTPFAGRWVVGQDGNSDASSRLRTSWELSARPRHAYLRVLAGRPFQVLVNGQALRPTIPALENQDSGQWLVNNRAGGDVSRTPELVDPDQIGSDFAADPTMYPRPLDPAHDAVARYRHQVDLPAGNFSQPKPDKDPVKFKRESSDVRRSTEKPVSAPEQVPPRSTLRDRSQAGYYAYDVAALLKSGANTIELRLTQPMTVDSLNWEGKAAVDGGAILEDGSEAFLTTDDRWQYARGDTPTGADDWRPVRDLGSAATPDFDLPKLTYRGVQRVEGEFLRYWTGAAGFAAVFAIAAIGLGWPLRRLAQRPAARQAFGGSWHVWSGYCSKLMLAVATVPVCAVILEMSMQERSEYVWFLQPWLWQLTAAITALVFAGGAIILRPAPLASADIKSLRTGLQASNRHLSKSLAWNLLVIAVLGFGVFLRAYQLDLQPLDDDEYASVQGVLAIAKTGAPGFVPDGVYYTRSPLHHYLSALSVKVFGKQIWALRLPSVLFGAGAAWLTYLMGVRLLRSHWVGFGAMLLMVLHPYEIFTSHVARFYQQQQFFAMLTMYWFCRGFVTEQSQRFRYLTIIGLLCTILSQEITIVLALQLMLLTVLFGKDEGGARNARLLLLAGIATLWVALDWLTFQTLCLTRLEGISPNFEARIKPHFWTPFNMFAIFIGYSRLHLGLSLFLVLDLIIGWRTRTRAFMALFVMLISGIVLSNLLITNTSLRYQYFLIPLWCLLCVDGMKRVAFWLAAAAEKGSGRFLRVRPIAVFTSLMMFSTVALSWSPWRIAGSYDAKLLPDSTGACRYVAGEMRPEDRVMATEPHSHAAYLEIGKVDYDLTTPVLYDFVVQKKGKLVDRNGGAEVVDSLERLQRVFNENERVWVLINREKFRSGGENLDWEYPGARVEEFIRCNAEMKYRCPFWSVYLWDRSKGHLQMVRGE
jgi:Dolichyl-phosphate-mannose-protein mannosyltransferase